MRSTPDVLMPMGPEKRLEALGRPREDQWLERKSLRVAPEVLARSIVGFANAEGGLIVLGLSDGVVEDASHYASRVNAVRRVPHTHCAPPPRARFHEVEVPGGTLLVIDVPPGDTLHETTNGECYLRVGDSITKLTATQREELAYDRGAAQFEARAVADVTVADLDSGLLAQLRTGMGSGLEDTKMLAARSLLTPSGGVTVAAYLLFHEHPQELMPHAHIRVLRHLSSEAGTGSRQSVMEGGDVRIEGAIEPSLRQATALLDEWVPKRQALRDDGRFGPVPVVPRDAWLEGLVNAVVHRSYSMAGDHIRVAVFPDRVEIESPGRFPGVVDPSRPLEIARYARNPRIARVCNDLGITQERGEGIRRIVDEMRLSGLEDPVYRQTSGSVRLTLFGNTRLSEKVAASLPTGAQDVLRILRSVRQPMGTGEIADAVGLARPATIRALKALQQINEVQWRGTSKQDPRATWSLPEL